MFHILSLKLILVHLKIISDALQQHIWQIAIAVIILLDEYNIYKVQLVLQSINYDSNWQNQANRFFLIQKQNQVIGLFF